ncbi:Aspartate aminotransferase [Carpediemonas membranifera]|uniref:Aspartate aminotransferase n=1 Tax=Carpediemonas membranifera TaxID=201153 RepID=A0A8J6BUP3_9EUKA|nr:Aspartate aminotransferase [Carpediemonas membranifera]|eukprot:KAG9390561.1 Aspartate aminotransferase [Carpediemonas membranifera]
MEHHNETMFSNISVAPPDKILKLNGFFKADPNPDKINLGVGAYRDANGKNYLLPSVRRAEQMIYDQQFPKEYLPIDGYAPFNEAAARLIFGKELHNEIKERTVTVQELSGTGSLRVAFEFIHTFFPDAEVYIPSPTWANHAAIVKKTTLRAARTYRYLGNRAVDTEGMLEDLRAAPAGSIILLHPCAHNPTGYDIPDDQWGRVFDVLEQGKLIPYFDSAYQGYASGDLDRDAHVIRDAVKRGFEVFVSQSFAKNMGLYAERAGALHIVCGVPQVAEAVRTQIKSTIRAMHSSSPCHGAYLAATVLNTPELRAQWEVELKAMAARIQEMRQALVDALEKHGVVLPGGNDHITRQVGMFSFTGLTPDQVLYLRDNCSIYMLENGRISMAGLNPSNVDRFAGFVAEAIKAKPF